MLLVDDDQAEVGERREDGRARPDADAGLPGAEPPPFIEALALGEPGVEHRHTIAEPGRDPPDGLRGEADLGDEQDRRPAALEGRLDRGEIDLGLAGAGYTVKEPLAGTVAVERGHELPGNRRLTGGEPWRRGAGADSLDPRDTPHLAGAALDEPPLGEPAEHDRVRAGRSRSSPAATAPAPSRAASAARWRDPSRGPSPSRTAAAPAAVIVAIRSVAASLAAACDRSRPRAGGRRESP